MAALVNLLGRLNLPGPLQKLGDKHRNDDFEKAPEQYLFPRTTREEDGEECLHDCATCSVQYPAKFSIDESAQLFGHIKAFDRHVLVATGKTDWPHDASSEKGSVLEAIEHHRSVINHGRLMLSASNIPLSNDEEKSARVLLLPAFLFVDNVTPSNSEELIASVINETSTNVMPVSEKSPSSSIVLTDTSSLKVSNCPHDYLVLLCSHKTRDARCGQTAPLIRKELERHLRPLGLLRDLHDERPGGVGIYFINHVGGHKFSANMLIYRRAGTVGADSKLAESQPVDQAPLANGHYHDKSTKSKEHLADRALEVTHPREASQCIWLARVRPEDCENIVRYTILKGKVVKPNTQLRGGFDRCKQLASW